MAHWRKRSVFVLLRCFFRLLLLCFCFCFCFSAVCPFFPSLPSLPSLTSLISLTSFIWFGRFNAVSGLVRSCPGFIFPEYGCGASPDASGSERPARSQEAVFPGSCTAVPLPSGSVRAGRVPPWRQFFLSLSVLLSGSPCCFCMLRLLFPAFLFLA